jgi:hypothetical protein
MADLRIVTLTGADAALGETVVERFGSGLRGELLCHDGNAYDEARKVWNSLIDKHPALIARCAGVGDVIDSVIINSLWGAIHLGLPEKGMAS